jgi:uncharacterized repeat protein (TIGR01451 family)
MNSSRQNHQYHFMIGMGISLLLAFIMVSFMGQALADSRGPGANLESSEKIVDLSQAAAGQSLQYTIFISNSGNMSATNVQLNDALPAELIYQTDSLSITAGSNYSIASYGENNGVITWTGSISGPGYVALTFDAVLTDSLTVGDSVTNTAVLTGTGSWLTRTATTSIVTPSIESILYLPVAFRPLPVPSLQLSAVINNQWTVSWTNVGAGYTYELEEANTSDFANATKFALSSTSQNFIHTTPNIYYYRVRALLSGQPGPWSEVQAVLIGQLTLSASRPDPNNAWQVSWTNGGSGVTTYELQESHDPAFSSPVIYDVDSTLNYNFQHSLSPNNFYCYRARAAVFGHLGLWSNVECVRGGYRDDFTDTSTNWAIRRQDTDDVDNHSYYQEQDGDNYFVLEIDGRWDYALASPLRPAPEPPYMIEARVRLNEPDNLNTYGFVFGGDWNGTSPCPNPTYTDCFNHYYRLMFLWFGHQHDLRLQLKRIDSHTPGNNTGKGKTLIDFEGVNVGSPPEGFKIWRIQVGADGLIEIFIDDRKVAQFVDDTYVNNPYFGVFAATDEYLGAEPWYDWYKVTPLPQN